MLTDSASRLSTTPPQPYLDIPERLRGNKVFRKISMDSHLTPPIQLIIRFPSIEMRFIKSTVTVDSADRTSLQVLAAGLPRCATSSMQSALETHFGLAPCMHFAHIAPSVQRGNLTLAALREKNTERRHKLLYSLFNGFPAAADNPACFFADDIMDMYPEAKIVLNKRPGGGHTWEESIQVLRFAESPLFRAVTFLWKTDQNLGAIWDAAVVMGTEKLKLTADELWTVKHYDAHNAWVHAEAAKRGREVLEFEPKDGWEELSAFLDKPTPNEECFPHLNDAAEVRMVIRILYARGIISWTLLGTGVYWASKWIANRYFS